MSGEDNFNIDRLFPLREPKVVADCAECVRFARQRHQAREVCDLSAVSDVNVLMRRHQAEVQY